MWSTIENIKLKTSQRSLVLDYWQPDYLLKIRHSLQSTEKNPSSFAHSGNIEHLCAYIQLLEFVWIDFITNIDLIAVQSKWPAKLSPEFIVTFLSWAIIEIWVKLRSNIESPPFENCFIDLVHFCKRRSVKYYQNLSFGVWTGGHLRQNWSILE